MQRALIVAVMLAASTAAAAPPPPPTAATKALMRSIARDRRVLAALVDRDAGVVFIDHFVGPGDPQPSREDVLCGARLDRQLKIVRGWLFAQLGSDVPMGALACWNRPGPPQCTFGKAMEWDPAVHLQFRLDADRGLVLTAITVDDEVLVAEGAIDAEHRAQARVIARLRGQRCAP